MPNNDIEELQCHLIAVDANNLYRHQLSKKLPPKDFKAIPINKRMMINQKNIETEREAGYYLVVVLEYSREIHDKMTDLPLAQEMDTVADEILTAYQKDESRIT